MSCRMYLKASLTETVLKHNWNSAVQDLIIASQDWESVKPIDQRG